MPVKGSRFHPNRAGVLVTNGCPGPGGDLLFFDSFGKNISPSQISQNNRFDQDFRRSLGLVLWCRFFRQLLWLHFRIGFGLTAVLRGGADLQATATAMATATATERPRPRSWPGHGHGHGYGHGHGHGQATATAMVTATATARPRLRPRPWPGHGHGHGQELRKICCEQVGISRFWVRGGT